MNLTNFIRTHSLAKELLDKPDGYLVASDGEREYIISGIRRTKTHANADDTVTHWALLLDNCEGNIIR